MGDVTLTDLWKNVLAMRTTSLLLALFTVACSAATSSEVDLQRQIWADSNVDSYEYELTLDCYCDEDFRGPFIVTVERGEVRSIVRVSSDSDPVSITEYTDGLVPDVFDLIESNTGAASIEVTYDDQLGYPTSVILDPSSDTIDDELALFINDFNVLGD